MSQLQDLPLRAAVRWQIAKPRLTAAIKKRMSSDRGEGAVSTAVIVVIVALAAIALGVAITGFITRWSGRLNAVNPPQ